MARMVHPEDLNDGRAPLCLRDDGKSRGLHFFCINANIKRQFEFVQQELLNNSRFLGLYGERDPLVGDHDEPGQFTIQQHPLRQRVFNIPRFVKLRGGAYFFVPSLRAFRFLAATA